MSVSLFPGQNHGRLFITSFPRFDFLLISKSSIQVSGRVKKLRPIPALLRNSRIGDTLRHFSTMETWSLKNSIHVCDIPEQMKQDFSETRTTCNARNSFAWDNAFFTSPGILEPEELFQTLNSKKCSSSSSALNFEPFSSRKSLAWDDAFLSEEGVLNPEELSIVNGGLPPGINKRLWSSTESSLTTGSEGSTLTRLEMDLFEDIRRSVPKRRSLSKICASSLKLGRGAALHNKDDRSKTKAKATSSSRRKNTTAFGSLRESHFPRPTKHAAGNGERYTPSSLKPPRAERDKNILTSSTKRPPPDGRDVKSNNKTRKTASAHCLHGSKKPCFRDPHNPIFSSMPLLKGCLSASLVDMPESTLRSPQCMPSKSPSVTPGKSSNKVETRDAASVTFGTPLRNTKAKKMEVENSRERPLLSTPKSSSFLSPASSKGKWSSRSSDSATKSYGGRETILAKQCGKVLMELDLDFHPDRETFAGDGNVRGTQHGKKWMNRHYSPLQLSKQNRPSCLRMPSPSIGYFNTENSQCKKIEGESEIWCEVVAPGHYQLQCMKGGEKSPAMAETQRYTSQNAAPDISESLGFSDRIQKVEKTVSNKEGRKDYSSQSKVKCGNSGYKAGGRHGETISRKIKRKNKELNKENMPSFEDPVENLVRYVRVLDLNH